MSRKTREQHRTQGEDNLPEHPILDRQSCDPTVVMMMEFFSKMQEQTEARIRAERDDAERRALREAEERRLEREKDAEKWQLLLQQQQETMAQLKLELDNKREDPSTGKGIPKHQKLNDTEDIDAFLSTFQSHMSNFKVNKKYWVANLVPLLTDRVRDMYATLDDEIKQDYDLVKDAILEYFNITPDTYRMKYKEARKRSNESWVDFGQRMLMLKGKWTKGCKSAQEVRDITTMEDVISLIPDKVQSWVRDQKPTSTKRAAQLADEYYLNRPSELKQANRHSSKQELSANRNYRPDNPTDRSRPKSQDGKETQPQKSPHGKSFSPTRDQPWRLPKFDPVQGPRCFACNEYGHIADACPTRTQSINLVSEHPRAALYAGRIAGRQVERMLVDTGASRTIVNSRWVPKSSMKDTKCTFSAFCGAPRELYLANITISVNGDEVDLEVAVQDDLRYDALSGLDIPFLWNLGDHLRHKEEALAVQTRAQIGAKQTGCRQ